MNTICPNGHALKMTFNKKNYENGKYTCKICGELKTCLTGYWTCGQCKGEEICLKCKIPGATNIVGGDVSGNHPEIGLDQGFTHP